MELVVPESPKAQDSPAEEQQQPKGQDIEDKANEECPPPSDAEDRQTQRTNQILEDMLRACALKYKKSWDKSLPYAEFSYNNSYQASIKMVLYEALYGR
jgi:hypothetical protein